MDIEVSTSLGTLRVHLTTEVQAKIDSLPGLERCKVLDGIKEGLKREARRTAKVVLNPANLDEFLNAEPDFARIYNSYEPPLSDKIKMPDRRSERERYSSLPDTEVALPHPGQ